MAGKEKDIIYSYLGEKNGLLNSTCTDMQFSKSKLWDNVLVN